MLRSISPYISHTCTCTLCKQFPNLEASISIFIGHAAQLLSHDKTRLLPATLWIKKPCFRNVSRCIITFVVWQPTKPDDCERNRVALLSFCSTVWGLSCNSFGESVRENVCIDWMQIAIWAESREGHPAPIAARTCARESRGQWVNSPCPRLSSLQSGPLEQECS